MNEFDRIFSELFFSPHKRMSLLVADIITPDDVTPAPAPPRTDGTAAVAERLAHDVSSVVSDGAATDSITKHTADSVTGASDVSKSDVRNRVTGGAVSNGAVRNRPGHKAVSNSDSSGVSNSKVRNKLGNSAVSNSESELSSSKVCDSNRLHDLCAEPVKLRRTKTAPVSMEQAPARTPDFSVPAERTRYINDSLKKLKRSVLCHESDKLFSDLLDDLDNISAVNSDSARRRKRARDIFSDWLFHSDDACAQIAGAGAGRAVSDVTRPLSLGVNLGRRASELREVGTVVSRPPLPPLTARAAPLLSACRLQLHLPSPVSPPGVARLRQRRQRTWRRCRSGRDVTTAVRRQTTARDESV